ncbi:MAG: hypothetical protein HGA65_00395 [Oscillochloris sp.]|nr:hypothetical protein [Oscillochloris sp.]
MYEMIVADDRQLLKRQRSALEPIVADLVDIAIAVHVADRLVRYGGDETVHRHISLPLRHPEIFASATISNQLEAVLHGFTEDTWTFEFRRRQRAGRSPELQMRLEEPTAPIEVALWSGGLDALAGLYYRLTQDPGRAFTLFSSTNGNRQMHGIQRRVWKALQASFPAAEIKLEQIAPRIQRNGKTFHGNFVPRTRGFVFLLLGAVVAHLEGQKELSVFENGVGAINLPFLESSVRYDQSRAVHPVSLYLMSEFVSSVLQNTFRIHNPFIFQTKAQVVMPLLEGKAYDLIKTSITCDRRHRHPLIQCGRCSSCLLRRQALAVHGWNDTEYVIPHERRRGRPLGLKDGDYFRAMNHQVERLRSCLRAVDPWESLTAAYEDLSQVAQWVAEFEGISDLEVQTALTQMYRQYVKEWNLPGIRVGLAQELLTEPELHALAI